MSCMKLGVATGCLYRSASWPCMRYAVAEQVRVGSWEQRRNRGCATGSAMHAGLAC